MMAIKEYPGVIEPKVFGKSHLEYTNKEKCYNSRKSHMNHRKRYGKWKIEVFWRKNPLQKFRVIFNN